MARTPASAPPRSHFVVDGSNIATEGRSQPSLQQLNDAVMAFLEDHPDAIVTVVVDATFGHRIENKEVKEFDAAVANNELVTPPAGAVGRGDAFVLSIAHKAKAGILSNDSFQEFHGKYDWLFDSGRLIGGKPVPHVGWVFVERSPVRGPKSRQSVKEAKHVDGVTAPTPGARRSRRTVASVSPLANDPLPVPSTPPPGPARNLMVAAVPAASAADAGVGTDVQSAAVAAAAAAPANAARTTVNDLVPFLDFVERHPVGTSCTAVIESYSSHGAYARADAVLVYIPLRLMDSPPPRSARSRLKLGEAVTLVVVGYAPERRSVDAALPHMAPSTSAPAPLEVAPAPKRTRRTSKPPAEATPAIPTSVEPAAPAEPAPLDAGSVAAAVDGAEAAEPTRRRSGRRAKSTVPTDIDAAADVSISAAPDTEPADPAPAKRQARARASKRADVPVVPQAPPAAEPAPVRATRARKVAAPTDRVAPAKKPAAKPAKPAKQPAKRTTKQTNTSVAVKDGATKPRAVRKKADA